MAERTVQDVLDTFNEEQLEVLYYMIGLAIKNATNKEVDINE